jgi:hypothetical protein
MSPAAKVATRHEQRKPQSRRPTTVVPSQLRGYMNSTLRMERQAAKNCLMREGL